MTDKHNEVSCVFELIFQRYLRRTESSPAKDLGMLVGVRLNTTWRCHSPETKRVLECALRHKSKKIRNFCIVYKIKGI